MLLSGAGIGSGDSWAREFFFICLGNIWSLYALIFLFFSVYLGLERRPGVVVSVLHLCWHFACCRSA